MATRLVLMPDPGASKRYQDDPDRLKGADPADVERELDETLVVKGGWTKSTSADGNGLRYTDGKGGLVIVNRGYPESRLGGGDALHRGPYVKIMPGNIRIPLAGNPVASKATS